MSNNTTAKTETHLHREKMEQYRTIQPDVGPYLTVRARPSNETMVQPMLSYNLNNNYSPPVT